MPGRGKDRRGKCFSASVLQCCVGRTYEMLGRKEEKVLHQFNFNFNFNHG
jgi:hypothetical protein